MTDRQTSMIKHLYCNITKHQHTLQSVTACVLDNTVLSPSSRRSPATEELAGEVRERDGSKSRHRFVSSGSSVYSTQRTNILSQNDQTDVYILPQRRRYTIYITSLLRSVLETAFQPEAALASLSTT